MYALGRVGTVKLSLRVNTGCTHNLLSKFIFDKLLPAMKERLEPWDTTATLVGGSGIPIYVKFVLSG